MQTKRSVIVNRQNLTPKNESFKHQYFPTMIFSTMKHQPVVASHQFSHFLCGKHLLPVTSRMSGFLLLISDTDFSRIDFTVEKLSTEEAPTCNDSTQVKKTQTLLVLRGAVLDIARL